MNGDSSIKNQIRNNADMLNAMEIVGTATVERIDTSKLGWKNDLKKDLFAFYKTLGNSVKRNDIGDISVNERQLSNALRYVDTEGEVAAFFVAHSVLRRGIILNVNLDHKNRRLKTITFAAPVEINGIRGNVAVVVKSADKIRYKAHRILTSDGNVFSLDS
jgi:hypothetical protein